MKKTMWDSRKITSLYHFTLFLNFIFQMTCTKHNNIFATWCLVKANLSTMLLGHILGDIYWYIWAITFPWLHKLLAVNASQTAAYHQYFAFHKDYWGWIHVCLHQLYIFFPLFVAAYTHTWRLIYHWYSNS